MQKRFAKLLRFDFFVKEVCDFWQEFRSSLSNNSQARHENWEGVELRVVYLSQWGQNHYKIAIEMRSYISKTFTNQKWSVYVNVGLWLSYQKQLQNEMDPITLL